MTNAEKMVWAAAFGASMEEQVRGRDHHGGHAVRAIHVARMAVEAFRDARTINVRAEVHDGSLAAEGAAALRSALNLLHEMHEPDEEG